MHTLLVIDDNDGINTALRVLFKLHDINVLCATTIDDGLDALENHDIQLVIQDMNFTRDTTSGEEGQILFSTIRSRFPKLPIILLTAWTHVETAVELMKHGAADYLSKPWDDNKLVTTVKNLLALHAAEESNDELDNQIETDRQALTRFDLCGIVFESLAMLRLVEMAIQVSRADVPVLITGPNGAGKEKIAQIVHANSGREGKLFTVNAGALPTELIEAELFGAETGAFTGAKQRSGRFELADGGTLFLDEIANLPLAGQMKLLRVLQSGEFERLGSSNTQRVDVRIITATNSDLRSAIEEGRFREDLYYRINVIELVVPSLNQRSNDILPLAEHFLAGKARLSETSKETLLNYHWPGNVRELENCMKRSILLCNKSDIEPSHLALETVRTPFAGEPNEEAIRGALLAYNGVVSRAARSVGLSRQAFYRRMKKYGMN